jgi:hypothetical protein
MTKKNKKRKIRKIRTIKRGKHRRKRRRETLMMKHLKRVTMVMKRDRNSIISPIHQIVFQTLSNSPTRS